MPCTSRLTNISGLVFFERTKAICLLRSRLTLSTAEIIRAKDSGEAHFVGLSRVQSTPKSYKRHLMKYPLAAGFGDAENRLASRRTQIVLAI
jgi:hypothetical protein